jgi:enoyl-CoA hydratase/carnithine racemase
MAEHLTVQDESGVRLILLNRPERKNALTQAMYAAMNDAIAGTDADPTLRVTVIAADGPVFTSGNDLADFAAPPADSSAQSPAARFPMILATAQKPLIAAVNGLAVGVGVTLLAQCDLAYAVETASFRAPFIDLALVPEGASSLLIPAAAGRNLDCAGSACGRLGNAPLSCRLPARGCPRPGKDDCGETARCDARLQGVAGTGQRCGA